MKDSKSYSPKINQLLRSLKRKGGKVTRRRYEDPIEALVYAIVSEHTKSNWARLLVKDIRDHFVDLNDLRVCRKEEIMEILIKRMDKASATKTTATLSQVLNALYNQLDDMSLKSLQEEGKRDAKKDLESFEGMTHFVSSYCLLTSLGAHAIPLTQRMIEYIRAEELVHPEATDEEICGFIDRQIASKDAYTFYVLLRRESETGRRKKVVRKTEKKSTTQKKAKKKSTKKTKKKATTKKKTKTKVKKKTSRKATKKTTKKKTRKKKTS